MSSPVIYIVMILIKMMSVSTQLIGPGTFMLCDEIGCFKVPYFNDDVNCNCRLGGYKPEVCADSLLETRNQSTMPGVQMSLNSITYLTDALMFIQQSSSCQKMADDVPITVVNSCPTSSKMADKANCEKTTERLPPVDYISAIDITFKNIHCAVCHGLDLNEAENLVAAWSVSYNCSDTVVDRGIKMADTVRECQTIYEPRDYSDIKCSLQDVIEDVLRNECSQCLEFSQKNVSTDGEWSCLICQFAFQSVRGDARCPFTEMEGSLTTLFQLPIESEKRIKINQQVFKITEFCADDEKFDNLFQKCRKFLCKTGEYAKAGECWKRTTSYVPSSSQPFPTGTDLLYVDIVKTSKVLFGESFANDFERLIASLDSKWRLNVTDINDSEEFEGSASMVVNLTDESSVEFVDSLSRYKTEMNYAVFRFTFYNHPNINDSYGTCDTETLKCMSNAKVLFVKENWFAQVEIDKHTLLFPLENILFRMTTNSFTNEIALEKICVCPHSPDTDVSTAINCSQTPHVWLPFQISLQILLYLGFVI